MTAELTIRDADLSDGPAVVDLWRTCGLVTPTNDPLSDFHFAMAGPASSVLLAQDASGHVVGSVMVGHDGHRGWLYYVATAPASRREGVGRALVEAAEQRLRAQGVVKVQLLIRETNAAVSAFYERLGFGTVPRIVMAKWLSGPDAGKAGS